MYMLEEFRNYILNTCQCSTHAHFLLAVSGGVDSTVMSHLFKKQGFNFSIAHCNFGLRAAESDGDQLFVENLARELGVKVHVKRFNTRDYADEKGISIQMAARDLRYSWFDEIVKQYQYDYIATAHNENDVVETVLLNLSRGTGIRGMMGIRPAKGNLIRPLLFAKRSLIEAYAIKNDLTWRTDSSNEQVKYHRNKIRHMVIPTLESINPAFINNASATIRRIEKAGTLLDLYLDTVKKDVLSSEGERILIHREKLLTYPEYDLILFELLRDYGVSRLSEGTLADLLLAVSGKQLHTQLYTITSDRQFLIISKRIQQVDGECIIEGPGTRLEYPISLSVDELSYGKDFEISTEKHTATLDAEKVKFPLLLRLWKPGDRFYPLGLHGSKKISDYLINCKIPVPDKKNIWVLESSGQIIWLVNHRLDDRYKITGETSKILLCKYDHDVKNP